MLSLHYVDYIVFALLLLISALVGPYYMWRDRNKPVTSESYFSGNRALHVIPTAASLFASFWSAIALVGIPLELYTGGAKFFMSSFGQAIGVTIGAFVVVPVVYRLKLISSYEYFERRFKSRLLRKIGTVSFVLAQIFYLAAVTYAPCIALEAVSPIPLWASASVAASVTMVYTVLGGIKAVVLVDFMQAAVMFGGVLIAIVIGYAKIDGGFSRAMDIARNGGRLDFFDLNPDLTNTYNFWIMVFPAIFADAGIYATSQAAVQRYSALPTARQASWSVMSLAPQILTLKLLLFFLSLAMFVHYDDQGCDPLRSKIISNPNQLTTFYIADILHDYPGLIGLWFAALFSGSLSTMSTGYNSVAACIWEDLLKKKLQKKLTSRGIGNIFKLITLLLGISTCLIAVVFKHLGGTVIRLTNSTVAVFGAAIYIAYFTGALVPFVNALGTIIGMVVATLLIIFIAGGQLYFRLGNEQVWLPTKTSNCSAMLANLVSSGKWHSSAEQMKTTAKAVTAGLMLLTAAPAVNVANNMPTNTTIDTNLSITTGIESRLILPETQQGVDFFTTTMVKLSDDETSLPNYQDTATKLVPMENETKVAANETQKWEKWMSLPKPLLYTFSVSYFIFPFLSLQVGFVIAIAVSLCTGGLELAKIIPSSLMIVNNCFYQGGDETEDRNQSTSASNKDDQIISLTPKEPNVFTVVNQANEDEEENNDNYIVPPIVENNDEQTAVLRVSKNKGEELLMDDDDNYVNADEIRENRLLTMLCKDPKYLRVEPGHQENTDAVEMQPLVSS